MASEIPFNLRAPPAWRSEMKAELSVIDRRGGHSRSYAHLPHRLVNIWTKFPDFLNVIEPEAGKPQSCVVNFGTPMGTAIVTD